VKLVVGLGNPGDKYSRNRHNVGHILVDELADKLGLEWKDSPKLKAKIAKNNDLILVKTTEFMNMSGISVSLAANFYKDKVSLGNLIVIHDDVDLEFGEVKKQFSSGAAGHHGVESIISSLGTKDFWRIRVGIGRPANTQAVEDFVLSNLSDEEFVNIRKTDIDKLIG
jgi:peptidyl-tRNA hydrolase, PTH1 family